MGIVMKVEEYSPLTLAFIGDAHFNLTVKEYVITLEVKPDLLQKHSSRFVSANAQARFMEYLLKNDLLSEEEIEIYKRGRNTKAHKAPKNTDAITYHVSTGFECLWGYLYLKGRLDRIGQIWDIVRTMEEN